MRYEIEQKFRTPGHAEVTARLAAIGAEAWPRLDQEDAYLSHPARDFAATHEALRIRRVGDANAVTYKGPKHEGPTKTREEIEVPFADGAGELGRLSRMFELLGFRQVAVIRKTRTPYRLTHEGRTVEVVLDTAEGVGTFVEVEAIAEGEADLPEAQRVVLSLGAALGLTEVEPRSYLRMALEARNPAGQT
ncbi:MAG: class IV adenylate cyclase [Planctomycetia bacterium]|nr:class IV adenylate cyclase [Planctomycetia bacterium]